MVLAAAGLREAGEARAAAGAAVGECCSVREGRSRSPAPRGTPTLAEQARSASTQDVGTSPKGCLLHGGSPCQKMPMRFHLG